MMRRLIGEPLLHFALLGGAMFVAYGLLAEPAADNAEIVVTSDRIASLSAQFSAMRGGRPPTGDELRGLIETYVRDEMLYREGLALGLDRDDPVVRARVRQKADILSSDALAAEPTDAELQAYLEAHQPDFDISGRISFEQVYFDPTKHTDSLETVSTRARAALAVGTDPEAVGDRTMLPRSMTQVMLTEVRARFGEAFEQQLTQIDKEGWQGPFTTPFGAHLVRVTWREPVTRATLENARDEIARDWARVHTAKMKDQFYRSLAERYTVRIEAMPRVGQIAQNEAAR
jgi:hypothetical protein